MGLSTNPLICLLIDYTFLYYALVCFTNITRDTHAKENVLVCIVNIMLPVVFSESAKQAIKKLDQLELTFRVFGVMPNGHLAIEGFARDMRGEEPFKERKILIFEEENIKLYIPKHHLKLFNQ